MRFSSSRLAGLIIASLFLLPGSAFAQAKLGYQQKQLLDDAKYYLLQVDGNLKLFDERSANWKVGDSTVQMREVEGILGTRPEIDKNLTYVTDRFKQLPADHPDVVKVKKNYDEVAAHVEKTFGRLAEIKAGLSGVVAQGESPEFKKDFDRLLEINQTFSNPGILQGDPERDVEIVKQLEPVKAERKRFAEKYAALLNQQSGEAQTMKNQLERFDESMADFDKRAAEWKQKMPGDIEQQLNAVIANAKDAAAQKKALWFSPTSDMASTLRRTEGSVNLLSAFGDSAEAKATQAKLASAKAEFAAIAKTLEGDILESNRVPDERFSGPDKDALVAKMREKWAAEGLRGDVLKAGMNSSGWQRETSWKWSGSAWYKVDYSWTQGFIVRKLDDQTAAVYHMNFSKDHLKEDRISVGFFDELQGEPSLAQKVLIKNIK